MSSNTAPTRPSMATSICTILAGAFLVSRAAGQDASKKPKFAYPPDGSKLVFNMMDTVMVTYTAFYDTGTLYTFCQPGTGKMIYQQKAPGFTASVPILLNFTSPTPCWFNIRTGVDGIDGENSATFNLIGEERSTGRKVFGPDTDPGTTSSTVSTSSTSTASSSSTAGTGNPAAAATTTSGSSSTTIIITTTTTGNPAPTDSPAPASGGLSAGASAGIGVGAALGVLLLAALAFIFWRRRRRQHHRPYTTAATAEMDGGNGGGGAPPYGIGSGGGYGHGYGVPGMGYGNGYGHSHGHDHGGGGDAPGAQQHKWAQQVGELDTVHTPAEIATSAPGTGTGRTHHEMSA